MPSSLDRRWLASAAIVLAIVFFVALNVLVGTALKRARLDLTADGLYTVSAGTKGVLAGIDEPIRLRYFRSQRLESLGPYFATHIKRVDELLDEYARLADGNVIVERYDPEPYSPEEDLAVADGIQGLAIDEAGRLAYFGLVGTNSTDDRKAIPYLAPERAEFLEYDLTRLIADLAEPEKDVVAVIGSLPLEGDAGSRFQPWLVHDLITQVFQVRTISGAIDRLDDDVEILMLVQPTDLDERTRYAIDQFVMRGGRVLAFVDPYAEVAARSLRPATGDAIGALAPLLDAWGIAIDGTTVIGDRVAATRVQTLHQGRQVVTDYLPWLTLGTANVVPDDAVVADLSVLTLRTAGAIEAREGATTTLSPLLLSGPEADRIAVDEIRFAPDPVALLRAFTPTGTPFILAARIGGPVGSAFPEGPPAAVQDQSARAAHRRDAVAPLAAIVVADVDLLADDAWVRTGSVLGQTFTVPSANNGDFVVNALEALAGGAALADLRGRGITVRRFDVLDAMTRAAEDRYLEAEESLLDKIDEIRRRIGELQTRGEDGPILLTAEQQTMIEAQRGELLELRRELRDVQYALRRDVEGLKRRLELLNIWLVPALCGVAAIALAIVRRRRAARVRAADDAGRRGAGEMPA